MDELNKLGNERRRGLLTLEALRTGGASITILDAQLGQVEKVLQVISKSDDLRDRCIEDMLISQKVNHDKDKKIDELHNVVAKLEAKVVLLEAKSNEPEEKAFGNLDARYSATVITAPTQVPAGGAQKASKSRNSSLNADVVDSVHGRRGSGSSTNSGAVMFAAAVKGVKEPSNQRAADAFKERVRHLSRELSFESESVAETWETVKDQGMTGMESSNWRTTSSNFKTDAPEFRPQNLIANVKNSDVTAEANVSKQTSAPEEPLEPPKLFKPKLTAAVSEPILKTAAPEPTVIQKTSRPQDTMRTDGPEVGTSATDEESQNSDINVDRVSAKPIELNPANAENSTTTRLTEADEEVHPEEKVIREAFVEPMFKEPLGVTTAIDSFLGRITDDADTMDWTPFMKVLSDAASESRATARKAFEIYEVLVTALSKGNEDVSYLRRSFLQRCQKMFKKVLDTVRTNYVEQDCLEATLWFMARLYTWENFGKKREVLGLAVCEMLANLAKKTVGGMTIADSLTVIKELLEFMTPRLKTDMDSKLEKQILEISEAVVAQLSTFGPRMYKEQELARNILKYVDSLVQSSGQKEDEWA